MCSSPLQRRCLRPPCCLCSLWLCCCCSVSSGGKDAWRERTGPAQKRGNKPEQRDLKSPACLCHFPKKSASYDRGSFLERKSLYKPMDLFVRVASCCYAAVFCTRNAHIHCVCCTKQTDHCHLFHCVQRRNACFYTL